MAGEALCFRLANTVYNVASESQGLSCEAQISGNKVGISIGYYCAVRIRISFITISGDGARGPTLSTVPATTALNDRRKLEKGVPEGTPNCCRVANAAPGGVRSK